MHAHWIAPKASELQQRDKLERVDFCSKIN